MMSRITMHLKRFGHRDVRGSSVSTPTLSSPRFAVRKDSRPLPAHIMRVHRIETDGSSHEMVILDEGRSWPSSRHECTPPVRALVPDAGRERITRVQRVDVDGTFLEMVTYEGQSQESSQYLFTPPAQAAVRDVSHKRLIRVQCVETPGSFLEMVTMEEGRGPMSSHYPFTGEEDTMDNVHEVDGGDGTGR
jgi:hypothetical protein